MKTKTELRLTFNEDEDNYDRFRPTYVPELFRDIAHYAKIDQTKKVLEIGVGTGQATLPFLLTGCQLTGIELGDRLAAFTRQKFSDYPNFSIINTAFEDVIIKPDTYDLIYSATAFHWIDENFGYPKVFNSLKPGGTLALFWNHPYVNRDNDAVHQAVQKVYQKYRPSDKIIREFTTDDLKPIRTVLQKQHFHNIITRLYRQTRILTSTEYLMLLNTYSDHRSLSQELKKYFEQDLLKTIDRCGGQIRIYDTIDLYLAKK